MAFVEKEWLDDTRFQPIITDMRRTVQPVVRYKMNDILHLTTHVRLENGGRLAN